MTTVNLNQRSGGGASSGTARPIIPSDTYRMRCIEADVQEDNFAKPDRDGHRPEQVVLTFEMSVLTDEQQEIADERGEEWDTVRVWHRFAFFYGDVKAGGPSKFKEFLDNLVTWSLISTINLEAFELTSLVGIELKCVVTEYKKTMGDNAGKPGNKITGFAPVRVKGAKAPKNTPQIVDVADVKPAASVADENTEDDKDLPF